MAELDAIAELLLRQKKDLRESLEQTASRKVDTEALIGRIEELRQRAERTERVFGAPPNRKQQKKK